MYTTSPIFKVYYMLLSESVYRFRCHRCCYGFIVRRLYFRQTGRLPQSWPLPNSLLRERNKTLQEILH